VALYGGSAGSPGQAPSKMSIRFGPELWSTSSSKVQLCDAAGRNLSSITIVLHASGLTAVSGFAGAAEAEGNANPDNDFRFNASLGSTGGYIFNLSTRGLSSGRYRLQFTATGDPIPHSVVFGVK
jgi:hypothetical protein